MTAPAPDLPGLRLERVLGSGGYADVFLYRQQLPHRRVAVKVLKDAKLSDAQRRQFTAEANAMAGLADHPHIVPVFSAAVSPDGRPYIMMMFYSEPNLAVRAAGERLAVAEVLRVGIQIASAVETAHRAGILHRDIKPANLLVSQFGTPGLTDFGVAGQVAAMEDDVELGVSVPWAGPEVLYGTAPTSVASDVYSLAATLWHLLAGRSPFEVHDGDNSAFALMRRVRDEPLPTTGRPDVPPSLERLLRQAMAKEPALRTVSAIELARGLQAVEQELQLPRTEIVVTLERSGYSPAGGTGNRPVEQPDTHATVARPPTSTAPPAAPRPPGLAAPAPARSPRGLLVGGIVLLGAAVVAGVVILWPGAGSNGAGSRRSTSAERLADVRPGVPQITATRTTQGAIMYRWTYSAREAGDTYRWRELGNSGWHGITKVAMLTLPKSPTGLHCLRVRVVRANGSTAATELSPAGCAP